MRTALVALLAAALLAAPLAARAQARNVPGAPGAAGAPVGLALPVLGAAAVEEATAPSVNPAGLGFVGAATLDYAHQQGADDAGGAGDGLYGAGRLGPLAVGLSTEWLRPGIGGGPRYQLTTLGLAVGDGEAFSAGAAYRWWTTAASTLPSTAADLGLTWRPWRHLSLAVAVLDAGARAGGEPLPARLDAGAAARLLGDSLTVSADLVGDDRGRASPSATGAALGAALELPAGIFLSAQVLLPLPTGAAADRTTAVIVAVGWNEPQSGIVAGVTTRGAATGSVLQLRSSAERYPTVAAGGQVPSLDVAAALEPARTPLLRLDRREPDRWGDLLEQLDAARRDPEVGAVALVIDELPIGAGRIEELRGAVLALRRTKPVLVYLTGGATREVWLASAATAVAAPPTSTILVNGVARSTLYLRDGLARLGIAVEVARAGAYKSAPEPLTRAGPSPEASEMNGALLDDVFERLTADVAAGRHLEVARVRSLVDRGILGAEEARDAGLLDAVLWPDELDRWASERLGRRVRLDPRWSAGLERVARRWGRPPAIAVVRIDGPIIPGRSRAAPLGAGRFVGAATVAEQLRRAVGDPRVRAIVLRIDSPGGDATASAELWRAVEQAARKKPVIASLGDVAASGGYLAAAAATAIVAEPSTLTGSIGVFGLKPDLSGLLAKLSIARDVQARGRYADAASPFKPWTPGERAAVERRIEAFYQSFVDEVAAGRHLSIAEVEAVAAGRVWTGSQALARRLVDRLGGFAEAVALARERAGLAADAPWALRREEDDDLGVELSIPVGAGAAEELARALALLPELRTAALLPRLGTVVALPVEWVDPAPRR